MAAMSAPATHKPIVHFVGSIPLPDAETVFRTLSAGDRTTTACGLGVKLLVAPLLLAALYLKLFAMSGTITQVALFEAAMGPQIGGAIVATQYGLDPPLVTLMVGIGSVLAFLTLPIWWYALQAL
jgi:malate permease and related proteins